MRQSVYHQKEQQITTIILVFLLSPLVRNVKAGHKNDDYGDNLRFNLKEEREREGGNDGERERGEGRERDQQ